MTDDEFDLSIEGLTGRWDYRDLPPNVRLGDGCYIERRRLLAAFNSRRDPGLVLGNRVRLYAGGWGGSISVEPTGLVEIGDDSVLAGVQIMCAESISIGRRVVISYNAVIADSDFHPRDPELRRHDAISGAPYGEFTGFSPRLAAPVVIEDDVTIGINAIILKGAHIGRGAEIFAGSVVTGQIPAGARVVGNPPQVTPDGAGR
jgi:acetyltransferase-like isoleucine patch superfamily enzyme